MDFYPFPFFCKFSDMKIKKEYIGTKVKSIFLNQWFKIEEGNENLYQAVGLDIFESNEPKLLKNAKNKKVSIDTISGDSDGINNDPESEVSI